MDSDEHPDAALARELREEFADSAAAAEVIATARRWRSFALDAVPFPGMYACHVSVARCAPDDFTRIARALARPGGVHEGIARVMMRDEVLAATRVPDRFVHELDEVFRAFMQEQE